jgi:dGTP triphosphohydrolase
MSGALFDSLESGSPSSSSSSSVHSFTDDDNILNNDYKERHAAREKLREKINRKNARKSAKKAVKNASYIQFGEYVLKDLADNSIFKKLPDDLTLKIYNMAYCKDIEDYIKNIKEFFKEFIDDNLTTIKNDIKYIQTPDYSNIIDLNYDKNEMKFKDIHEFLYNELEVFKELYKNNIFLKKNQKTLSHNTFKILLKILDLYVQIMHYGSKNYFFVEKLKNNVFIPENDETNIFFNEYNLALNKYNTCEKLIKKLCPEFIKNLEKLLEKCKKKYEKIITDKGKKKGKGKRKSKKNTKKINKKI